MIFGVPEDNPMFDSFQIFRSELDRIACLTNEKIDIETYDCFLEFDGD